MSKQDVITKLTTARTRLIIDKPFLGALVLRLPLVEGDSAWCKTTATDAKKLYYNHEYISKLDTEETQFVLAHEALHCALSHFARRQHRDKQRWDVACDLAINPLLRSEGLKLTHDACYLEQFEDMTAEEIYPSVDESDQMNPHDQHVYDEQDNSQSSSASPDQAKSSQQPQNVPKKPPPQLDETQQGGRETVAETTAGAAEQPQALNEIERDTLQTQWQQRLAGAAQQAMQAGKMSASMARLVDFFLQPQLSWRNLLAHYVSMIARDDYSYARPSSRRGDPAIYPSLRSAELNVCVALDTSGSISASEMREFLSEINEIKSQMKARITLLACDAELDDDAPWTFEAWDTFELPREFSGGGGTSFMPVFNWVDNQDTAPNLLIYFTDAEGVFLQQPPNYPVLWLVKGKSKVPWGRRVQLN